MELDYDIFLDVKPPDHRRPHAIYRVDGMDFRLRKDSAAVDAAIHLPNINDDFSGAAPDLGALESGQSSPVYGPRSSHLVSKPERVNRRSH